MIACLTVYFSFFDFYFRLTLVLSIWVVYEYISLEAVEELERLNSFKAHSILVNTNSLKFYIILAYFSYVILLFIENRVRQMWVRFGSENLRSWECCTLYIPYTFNVHYPSDCLFRHLLNRDVLFLSYRTNSLKIRVLRSRTVHMRQYHFVWFSRKDYCILSFVLNVLVDGFSGQECITFPSCFLVFQMRWLLTLSIFVGLSYGEESERKRIIDREERDSTQ